MKLQRFLLIASSLLASAASVTAQQTKILTAEKHNEYGLVYFLPTTALRIDATAEIKRSVRGEFYQYARKFIGTDNVVKNDASEARITDIKVTPVGIANTETAYIMQLKPGATTYLCVADDGMLLAINKKAEAPESLSKTRKTGIPTTSSGRTGQEYLKYVDEDFIASQSSLKQAEMLAESLMDIRESKLALTRGTAESMPTDGRQLELMLASLEEQEKALTEAFTGFSETVTETRTFTYIPEDEGREVVFRLSDFAGFVEADDLSGDPVYITVSESEVPELPVDAKGEEKKLPKDAVIYALPGSGLITISAGDRPYYSARHELAQFGMTFGLAPTLFSDKKQPSWAEFNPVTGALKAIGAADPSGL